MTFTTERKPPTRFPISESKSATEQKLYIHISVDSKQICAFSMVGPYVFNNSVIRVINAFNSILFVCVNPEYACILVC